MDIKIALASRGLVRAIQAPDVPLPAGVTPLTDEQKYAALDIIRHHIHPDLKSEYLEEVHKKPKNSDRGKGTAKHEFEITKLCDKCGCYTHPTNKCKTPKLLAILYQQSQGCKKTSREKV